MIVATHPTREAWLEAAEAALRPTTQLADALAPRVSVGFPSKGALSRVKQTLGQAWTRDAVPDGRAQVYISPVLQDPLRVLDVLVHELGHVKHPEAKHGKVFKRYMKLVDLEGKATATKAGPQLTAVLKRVALELGPYPHVELVPSKGEKKQGTRLLKAVCLGCECTVRITAKWTGVDGNTLPFCGVCGIDGNIDTMVRMRLAE